MQFRLRAAWMLTITTVFVITVSANAQVASGSISGTVVDPSGAVLPGATVTLTNEGTSAAQHTTSTASGGFRFPLLPVGHYQLEVSQTEFSKFRISGIQVDANIERALGSLRLQVGENTESIEVTSAPPLIESAQAQISSAISGEALQNFAGVGEFEGMDFIALTLPGVAASRDNQFSNTNGTGFVVNGIRGRNNDQQIDGQNNNDSLIAGPSLQLSDTDFVSEYQATTGNFGPEYGRNSGSVINLLTKSGSNRWHGTVYGKETNSVLTSLTNVEKDFSTPPILKPPRFNQEFTGGTIGGPLKKDRVFAFGGFDDLVDASSSVFPSGALTPTPTGVGQLSACFPGSASMAALSKYGPFAVGGGSPTVSGQTVTSYYDNAPVNNTTDPNTGLPACGYELGGVQRTLPNGFHFYNFIGRLDVHPTDSDSFTLRYLFEKSLFFNAFASQGDIAAGYPFNEPALSQAALVDWTHTFSSRILNELRIGYSRTSVQFGGNTLGNTIPPMSDFANALTAVGFQNPSLLNFGVNILFPEGRVVNTYQLQDNFSFSLGQHQLKWGANITHQYSPNIFLPGYNGQFTFTDYGAFAANTPSAVLQVVGNPNYAFKEWDNFLYVGDDWKLKSNLTLNLGLTWSYLGQPGNILHQEGVKAQAANPPLWDSSLPLSVTTLPELTPIRTLFGPSVGFAWSPNGRFMGNGKTVVRGGYRLTYDPSYDNIYSNEAGSAPVVLSQNFTPTTSMPTIPGLPAAPLGPAVRAEYASLLPLGQLDPRNSPEIVSPASFRPDKVHGWSLGVQREITRDAVLEVRYVGNHAVDLFQSVNNNPYIAGLASAYPSMIPSGLTPCPAANAAVPSAAGRVNCNAGIQVAVGNTGFSNYNGLQTEFRATNIFNQLTLRTNYTFSKTLDNTSEIFNTFGGGNTESYSQNPLNVSGGEYGISGIDFPNTWTLSFVEEIPFMRAQHGVLGHILGGWALSGTYILQSGQPFTPAQEVVSAFSSPVEDVAFNEALNNGVPDSVRPFLGSSHAPMDQVGIYAADACASSPIFGTWAGACNVAPGTLLSLNGLNTGTGIVTPVNKNQVRVIANGAEADSIFGTPFGAGRNILRDYHTNIGDFTLFKNIKFGERASLQWNMTMNNVFNHPNYGNTIPGVNPFIENAGTLAPFTTFGNPKWVSSATLACPAGTRCVFFGLKVIY
ncbi:MAG TPA: carboxypeptidase regulatory-like domain-containing protein [Terriglobales bacterium]|nr:carboxypeptidase regulatory-like domain-containing protein [Terriglobales bacterium]